jgi:hypothetical protein
MKMTDRPENAGGGGHDHVKLDEVIKTIEYEADLVVALVQNPVDGPRLIIKHPCIEALEEIMQLIADTSPEQPQGELPSE